MKFNKSLEYKICFNKVKNLDEVKKNKEYFGSVEVDGNLYAITIDRNSKYQERAKEIIPEIISSFKDVYYARLKKCGKPLKEFGVMKKNYRESNLSEN